MVSGQLAYVRWYIALSPMLPPRPNLWILIGCIVAAVTLSLVYSRRPLPLGHDEGYYLAMARDGKDVQGVWPPVFPAVGSAALALGFPNLNIVSLLSLVLLLVMVYRVSIDLDRGPLALILITFCPAIFAYGWEGMSEMLFTLLVMLCVWLFLNTTTWWQGLLAGVLAVLSYQTRHLGIFLVGWMVLMVILKRNRWQIMATVVAALGSAVWMFFNLRRYGVVAGPRTESHFSFLDNLYYLGLTPWTLWIGEGPILRHPSLILSLIGLGLIAWAVIVKEYKYSLVVVCYLAVLIAAEMTVAVDPINRRFIFPMIPFVILLGADKVKRYQVLVISLAVVASLAHAVRGALYPALN